MLRKLGISHRDAYVTANSRRGYYHIARTRVIQTAISKERLNNIEEIVNSSYKLDKFDSECFNNIVDKIIVGIIDDNDNKNSKVIKFILKIGKSYDYVLTENKGSMSFENKNKYVCNGIL